MGVLSSSDRQAIMQIGVICAAKGTLPGPADEREPAGWLDLAASNGFIRRRSLPPGWPAGGSRCQQVEWNSARYRPQ
jgi:hypothetical protein